MATFLRNLVSRIRPGDGQICVAAFGKHPAWGDHLPDIGLVGRLVDARQALYLDGIRDKAISYWKSTDESQLIPFEHDLLWQRPDALIIGRLWASSDGATPPRRDFPMVLLADCTGLPLAWALNKVLPRLAKAEAACKATPSGEQVRIAVQSAEDDLRKIAAEQRPTEASSGGMTPHAAVVQLARLPDLGPEHRGLLRVLHVLADVNLNDPSEYPRAEQVRVPRAFVPSIAALEMWRKLVVARFGEKIETLLLVPRGQDWVDVLVGKPDAVQFNILRASPQLIPLTTEIGYSISPAFQAEVQKFLADCGVTAETDVEPPDSSAPDETAPASAHGAPPAAVVPDQRPPVMREEPAPPTRPVPPTPPTLIAPPPVEKTPADSGDEAARKAVVSEAGPPPADPLASVLAVEHAPVASNEEVTQRIAMLRPLARAAPTQDPPASQLTSADVAAAVPEAKPARPPAAGPAKKLPRGLWIAAAVVLVLLGAGLVLLPKLLKPQQLAETDWAALCQEYGAWFGDFEDSLQDAARVKRYSADPDLKKVVDAVSTTKAAGTPIDPRVILSRPGMSYAALAEKAVEKPLPADVVAKGKRAGEVIAEVKRAFTKEEWPLLRSAEGLRKHFGGDATAAGKELGQIVDDVNPRTNSRLTEAVDRLLGNAAAIENVSHCLATLAVSGPVLERSGDPSLKTFVRDANLDLTAAARRSFKSLAAEADALDQQVTEVASVLKNEWPNDIAREKFLNRAPPATPPATLVERLKAWRDDVGKYRRIPAAGSTQDSAEQDRTMLAAIEADVEALRRVSPGAADALAAPLAEARKAAVSPAGTEWVENDRPLMEAAARKRRQLLAALREKIPTAPAMAGKGDPDPPAPARAVPPADRLLAAWKKGAGLPVKDGRALERELLSALAQSNDRDSASVTAEVRREAAARWAVHLAGSDPARVEEACEAFLDEKAVDGTVTLEPFARYNLALYAAKRRPVEGDDAARAAAASLDKTLADLTPLADVPAVLDLREKLADAQSPETPASAGPQAAGWTVVGEEKVGDETIVTYEWKAKGDTGTHTPRLQFAKVPGDEKTAAFYLGTTEVSYRQFSNILGAGGNWDLLGSLLPHDQRRLGPKLWSFQNGVSLNPSWSYPGNLVQDSYPPSLAAPFAEGARGVPNLLQGGAATNPSPKHPMQYVNPAAAVYVAAVAGCRLPLAGEWKLAYHRFEDVDTNGKPRSLPNLRDGNWLRQYEWLKSKGNGRLALADVFSPGADFLAGKDPYEADEKTDDGFLYFAPVDSDTGRVVHHLAGNVAEFVVGGDRVPSVPEVRADKDVTDYLASVQADPGRGLMVVGGSALSHPKQPVAQAYPVPAKDIATAAYCDVGFRLAFSVPRAPSSRAKLAAAVAAAPYLPASNQAAASGK